MSSTLLTTLVYVCVLFAWNKRGLILGLSIGTRTKHFLVKCDVLDVPRLIAVVSSDPQPIRTVLASIGLPSHVTDAATVLVNGKAVDSRDVFNASSFSWQEADELCVHVLCGRLRGGGGGGTRGRSRTQRSAGCRSSSRLRARNTARSPRALSPTPPDRPLDNGIQCY